MSAPTLTYQGSIEKLEGHKWVCNICPAIRGGPRTFGTFNAALNHQRAVHNNEPPVVAKDENENGLDDSHHSEDRPPTWPEPDEGGWARIDPESYTRLTSDGLRQWEMHAHVDHVSDLVPFWQRGVEAAAKGKVLRLEEFLEKMEEDGGWRSASEVLEKMGVWNAPLSERGLVSDEMEVSHEDDNGWGIQEAWAQGDLNTGSKANCSAPPDGWSTLGRTRGKSVQAVRGGGRKKGKRQFVDDIAQQVVDGDRRKQMHRFFEMSTDKQIEKIEQTIRIMRTHGSGKDTTDG